MLEKSVTITKIKFQLIVCLKLKMKKKKNEKRNKILYASYLKWLVKLLYMKIIGPNISKRLKYLGSIDPRIHHLSGKAGHTSSVCMLGNVTTDFLEKEFFIFRQDSGGTYFIYVQQIIEKVNVKQSSLLLSLDVDLQKFNVESGHQYTFCSYLLCKEGSDTFNNLSELQSSIPMETKCP